MLANGYLCIACALHLHLLRTNFDTQFQCIFEVISQMEKTLSPSIALVQTSILNAFLVSSNANYRIVDLGATDHMASMSTKFSSYSPSIQPILVKLSKIATIRVVGTSFH